LAGCKSLTLSCSGNTKAQLERTNTEALEKKEIK